MPAQERATKETFRALGWDIENRPDYTFRIATASNFMVEAKTPQFDLWLREEHFLKETTYGTLAVAALCSGAV